MTEILNQEHVSQDLLVVSTNDIDGAEIVDYLGLVQGSTVRSRNVGSDFFANLKNIVGGGIKQFQSKLGQQKNSLSIIYLLKIKKSFI